MAGKGSDPEFEAWSSSTGGKNYNDFVAWKSMQNDLQNTLKDVRTQYEQLKPAAQARPGMVLSPSTDFERKAGVTAPMYEGTRDAQTGVLLDQFKQDPYAGEALQKLKAQGFAEGLSPWAQMQMDSQKLGQQNSRAGAQRQQMQAQSSAQGQLARSGGLTGGAAALLARQGSRDLMNSNQGISREGMNQRLGIEQQDLERKNKIIGAFGERETDANKGNINQSMQDINRKSLFDMERYRQQMSAWGAEKSADATRSAGGGGGKK